MDRQLFNEVQAVENANERYAQGRVGELIRLQLEIYDEEGRYVQNMRAEKIRESERAIAEIKNDLMEKYKIGVISLTIQRVAAEAKNRRVVNGMITDLKNLSEEMVQYSVKALEVLDAKKELYDKIHQSRKNKAKEHLTRITEVLSSISSKLNDLEQILACFELKDVQIDGICRQIKSQNSSFRDVISNLKQDISAGEIDSRHMEDFKDYRMRVYQMINCMNLISQDRVSVIEAIESRHFAGILEIEN
ncbi:hypothetical protein L5515_006026 [Caenorhabditis briggsae]|uniref:Uncharacterized protein n=1 Tax=Caenorhabditis briggsae TaxID=6238 RepID=A0AAE9JI86_CAEBR|nr:hypothetical protein L5515_006026 [Caenorhabditis briggsae]